MVPDITLNELYRISEIVLGNIVNAAVLPSAADVYGNGKPVACLYFFGELNGYVTLLISDEDIPAAADMIIKRFGIGVPVKNELVFAEFINMFAGNVITELNRKYKINLSLKTPEDIFIIDNNYSFSHLITTKNNEKTVKFKFHYSLKDKIL